MMGMALSTDRRSSAVLSGSSLRKEKREIILDAAIKVFAQTGYHGARVSDIAREAGIAYGLVYHYFKNKEEILHTIFEERWSGFLETVETIADSPTSTQERLVSVASLILHGYRVRPDWVKVLVVEIQRSSRVTDPAQIRAMGRLFQLIARILRRGQEAGEIRRDLDPEVACTVFLGALELAITSLVLRVVKIEGEDSEIEEYYSKVARTVVEICMNGMTSSRPGT
jgi:TetR/AcrR family fatty acid metabolism transcriptional regulator